MRFSVGSVSLWWIFLANTQEGDDLHLEFNGDSACFHVPGWTHRNFSGPLGHRLSGAVFGTGRPKLAVFRLTNPVATVIAAVRLTGPRSLAKFLFLTHPIATRRRAVPRAGVGVLAIYQLATPIATDAVIRAVLGILVGITVAIAAATVPRTPIGGLSQLRIAALVAAQFDRQLATAQWKAQCQ